MGREGVDLQDGCEVEVEVAVAAVDEGGAAAVVVAAVAAAAAAEAAAIQYPLQISMLSWISTMLKQCNSTEPIRMAYLVCYNCLASACLLICSSGVFV